MLRWLYPSTLALALLVSCQSVTIKNNEICSIAGRIQFGGICAETLTTNTRDLDNWHLMDMLEAQPERPDPYATPLPTVQTCGGVQTNFPCLPEHGAAIIMTTDNFTLFKTELETACRILGDKCTYEMKQQIKLLGDAVDRAQSRGMEVFRAYTR